jgi:protein-disulfide isomerase
MLDKSKVEKILSGKATIIAILVVLVAAGIYSAIGSKGAEPAAAATNKSANSQEIESIIAKWVAENPDKIIESVVKMQQKTMQDQQKNAQQSISAKQNEIFNNPNDPVHAPAGYDVTIAEFFDYNCGYCKRAGKTVEKLIAEDKKVRIIFKELPILGASSAELSKVSIAVNLMDKSKYVAFHKALMASSARSQGDALKVAKKIGLNVEKLKATLKNKAAEIEKQIQENQALAGSVGINGTPAFVIGAELIPGAVDIGTLKSMIEKARKK